MAENGTDGVGEAVVNEEGKGNEVGSQNGSNGEAAFSKVRDLPQLEVYFKMLRLGVPPQAVKLKMSREGFDPELVDDPEAPAPERLLAEAATASRTDNSDSSTSSEGSEAAFSD